MTANNFSHLPYEACLIPDLPRETQHRVRNIHIHVVLPLSMLLGVLSIVCNTLVCITVARTPSLHQRPSLLMLASLSITDLLYSVFALLREIETITSEHMCPGEISPGIFALVSMCNLATLGNSAIVSRDRYLAVKKPWWYRDHVTKSRALKKICGAWSVCVAIASVVYLSEKIADGYRFIGQTIMVLFYFVCLFVILFCYHSLYFKRSQPQNEPHMRTILEREKRLANTVGLIFVVLLLTFLPALLFPTVLYATGVTNFLPFRPFFAFLFQLNGVLNPLLNFGRTKDMRRALRETFKCSLQVQPAAAESTLRTYSNQTQRHSFNNPGDVPLEMVCNAALGVNIE